MRKSVGKKSAKTSSKGNRKAGGNKGKPRSSAAKTVRRAPPGPAPFDEAFILSLARRSIQALKPYVPGKSIEEVKALYNPPVITKLGSNENPLGPSGRVLNAVHAATSKISLYPDGSSRALRQALADSAGLTLDHVMVGNGSDEVLLNIAAAFLNPGEAVLVSGNTFSEYEFSGRVLDGKVVKVPLKDLRYDLAGFRKELKRKPKLLFLCNPNNPTGNYFTHDELLTLLRAAPRSTLVVLDEAYGEYATALDFPRSLELLKDFPNLIVSRTFSKIFGMAGLRLGYGFAHSLVVRECQRVKTPFNVNLLAQAGALAALQDEDFVRRSLDTNREGKAFLEEGLSALGLEWLPTQANFICFRTDRAAVELHEDLMRLGVIIRPLRSFGLDMWNRVTIGTREQNERFLVALSSCLRR